jgi:DNA polymerase-3 subunit delta
MDSLAFLSEPSGQTVQPVYALPGDEDFLKRQVLAALRRLVLGEGEDSDFGLGVHAGDKATFAAVRDDLDTLPFLSPRRLVVVEGADPFVSRYRALLEKYVAKPSSAGVLVLDVKTWPANTRLAKLLAGDGTLVCKALPAYKLPDWCIEWAARHGKQLGAAAARLLVDLVGGDMGQLDQELAKLAVYAGAAARIEPADVDALVGNSRTENTWKIFDAIGAGNSGAALAILDRLFEQGEEPLRILGAFSMQLRQLARAARLAGPGRSLAAAVAEAGIAPFAQRGCEQQLRHLGRRRADSLYDWLIEADLGLKGFSQLPPRALLERLVVRLARKA